MSIENRWMDGQFIYKKEKCLEVNVTFALRYRAVTSWSLVKQRGVPTVMAVKIVAIWLLSMVLAVPEAIGFNMISFNYNNTAITTCMLRPETDFMIVSVFTACGCVNVVAICTAEQRECVCVLFVFS